MSQVSTNFQRILGQDTRQIGQNFCIPAVVSNALRILGGHEFTQEWIRDLWYVEQGRQLEPNPDDQMTGAGPDVIDSLKRTAEFSSRFDCESFELPKANSFFDSSKADQTLDFIARHTAQQHPVLVSTDSIPWEQGILNRFCCHMWLILEVDRTTNKAVAHDPSNDLLFDLPLHMAIDVKMASQVFQLEIGLRGRLTTNNFFCA